MEIIIFIVIAALLLIPEFFHGWRHDGGYSCTGKRIDGGDCFKPDRNRRL
jgi:hypothetical protein